MQSKLTLAVLMGLALSSVASAQQSAVPTAPTGGDQLSFNCSQLIPRKIDDELPEGIPGGDMFDQGDKPGGDQFDPLAIPGGNMFVQTCIESFRELDLLIPGGDTFDPKALARVVSGELELGELPEWIPGGDTFSLQDIANEAGLGLPGSEGIIGIDGFTPEPDPLAIPGGDMFEPPADAQSTANPLPDNQRVQPVPVADACDWTGTWSSSYGDLRLIQKGQTVSGDYANNGTIEGTLGADCALDGRFDNVRQSSSGTIAFTLDGDRFNGIWGYDGQAQTRKWGGTRRSNVQPELVNRNMSESACVWTGTWSSSIGDLKLVQNGNQVSGQHRTNGLVSGTVDDCRLRGTIENPSDETARDFSIAKGARRFDGTWSWQDSSNFRTNVWGGTLRSAEAPLVSRPSSSEESNIEEGEAVAEAVPEQPNELEQDADIPVATMGTWDVSLGYICLINKEENTGGGIFLGTIGIDIYGLAWVKARVFDKTLGKEVSIAPVGGFPNLNGDQERAWELRSDQARNVHRCNGFGPDTENDKLTFQYQIDATQYGYADLDELLKDTRNRIRVMVKLGEYDFDSPNDELGTKAKSTPLAQANFCGSCNKSDEARGGIEGATNTIAGPMVGNGILSGFRDGADEVAVLYDIERLE